VRLEVLGSGGATTTPRPHCTCNVCVQAREKGIPYARTGPSVFVHGPDVLIDTPEESKQQLDRSRITRIVGALYSHWHPDHTAGRRVWETRNYDFRGWPREAKDVECTPVYLPPQVAADFRDRLGLWDHFEFLEQRQGTVAVRELADGEAIELDGTRITPVRLAEDYVYAFLFEGDGARLLVAMDELNGWTPPDLGPLDLAYLPLGLHEHHPFTGERLIHEEHFALDVEATYPETLEIVRALGARRTVLGHVEELDRISHDELVRLGARDGWEPAYDTMLIDVA
jgi:phosphoribosyl 1,2-cyclic phosphate phosphodiesterase